MKPTLCRPSAPKGIKVVALGIKRRCAPTFRFTDYEAAETWLKKRWPNCKLTHDNYSTAWIDSPELEPDPVLVWRKTRGKQLVAQIYG